MVNGKFCGCIINHDLDMFAMSQGVEYDFKASSTASISIKFMCSLVSSANQTPPVEQLLEATTQPCFEVSEVIVNIYFSLLGWMQTRLS